MFHVTHQPHFNNKHCGGFNCYNINNIMYEHFKRKVKSVVIGPLFGAYESILTMQYSVNILCQLLAFAFFFSFVFGTSTVVIKVL